LIIPKLFSLFTFANIFGETSLSENGGSNYSRGER
jgi:hypothetical protein